MTLCDASPLFALLDVSQQEQNARCNAALPSLPAPLVTTWPCFTEAMYLVYTTGGWPMQRLLWQYVTEGTLTFHELGAAGIARMQVLMAQYQDTPMDLADASLVAAAEALNLGRIFTLDSDFYVYRMHGRQAFEVVP